MRGLRKRLGMTQRQLAERLRVDQGTVSRWERSVEQPRPAKQAELQKLLNLDDNTRAMLRARAFVHNDFLPSVLLDSKLRLVAISDSGKRYYRDRGMNPRAMMGMSLDWIVQRQRNSFFFDKVEESGLLHGECIFFRFVTNSGGRGHATVYEPIFDEAGLAGMLCYITFFFDLPAIDGSSIALIEAVPTIDPDKVETLYRGPHADHAIRALSKGSVAGRSYQS
nr:helix-turn-helix transcriptional regulator [Roseovarius aestuariivivens]